MKRIMLVILIGVIAALVVAASGCTYQAGGGKMGRKTRPKMRHTSISAYRCSQTFSVTPRTTS